MDGNRHLWYVYVTLRSYSLHGGVDTRGYPGAATKICVRKPQRVNDETVSEANARVRSPHDGTGAADGIRGRMYVRAHLVWGIRTCAGIVRSWVIRLSLLGTSGDAILMGGGRRRDWVLPRAAGMSMQRTDGSACPQEQHVPQCPSVDDVRDLSLTAFHAHAREDSAHTRSWHYTGDYTVILYHVFYLPTALVRQCLRRRRVDPRCRAGGTRSSPRYGQRGCSGSLVAFAPWAPSHLLRSRWVCLGLNGRIAYGIHRCVMWQNLSLPALNSDTYMLENSAHTPSRYH